MRHVQAVQPYHLETNPMRFSVSQLAGYLRLAANAHHESEQSIGHTDADWPEWYAQWIERESRRPYHYHHEHIGGDLFADGVQYNVGDWVPLPSTGNLGYGEAPSGYGFDDGGFNG